MSGTSKVWMLKKLFEGEPKLSDFELEEQELRDINDGGKIVFVKRPAVTCSTTVLSFINISRSVKNSNDFHKHHFTLPIFRFF